MNKLPTIEESDFGNLPDGTKISLFTLTNQFGTEVKIINYGGIITSIKTRDKQGNFTDIVLGFGQLQSYLDGTPYFGALIGRFANRLKDAKFQVDGTSYQLDKNDGNNHLHGGLVGFDKRAWTPTTFTTPTSSGLKLSLLSEDGDQGYPGNLSVNVTYTLTNENELITELQAQTDKATPINFTQHSYFNLAGEGSILDHVLTINAEYFTPVDNSLIPTGEISAVANTPFDFTSPTAIGAHINDANQQLKLGRGYDHNFILDSEDTGKMKLAATVVEPNSGRILEVWTEEPAIQFYSGNFLDGSLKGKNRPYDYRTGFCLEPQHYPDAPNQPSFPNTILQPGDTYSTRISYRFSTVEN